MYLLPMTYTIAYALITNYMTTTFSLITKGIDKAYAPINKYIVESILIYYQ